MLSIPKEQNAFQNKEKEKDTEKLIIANKELLFQYREKEKRAEELIIANKELAFQIQEKEKNAKELIIANKELVLQNEENEKRAAELLHSNLELKLAEKRLSSLNLELESFTYSVSHDLRAPLRAVHGYARMLQDSYSAQMDPEASRYMDNIMSHSKKMSQLIDDLLSFSKIGRKDLVKVNISMFDMVTRLCDELHKEHRDRIIEFKIGELPPANVDRTAMQQVWLNLISNAIKYSKLKKRADIEIGSEMKDGEVIYYIKDNGAGFDMRYINKLFGVFQRLHSDEEFEGTGVGLAIVQRIIIKHGGHIWADSIVDEGATFYFSLNK